MTGTIANTCAIVAGTLLGAALRRGIKERYQSALYTAMGLCAVALGFEACAVHLPKSTVPVLFIVSLAVGSLAGAMLRLDERFKRLASRGSKDGRLGEGLCTGVLLYCLGSLSMVGPVLSALHGDNTYLYANATLDLVSSAVLASTYGIGMIWAAPVLFCWQGAFYLAARLSSGAISDALLTELSIVGGALVAATGFGILGIKDCKTLNMLPSLLVPVLYFLLRSLF